MLFGLAISFIPASPVFSDNITACRGSGSPTSSLKLGGRTITPTLLLQAASGTTCPTEETSLGLVTLSRTIIVSPVLSPTQNGTALLSAMNLIANSNPSAANPWLLKLEPGNYDLGNGSLTLLPYVDLEGSGEGITTISSSIGSSLSTGTLVAASNIEVRFLTITNAGTANYQMAVFIPNNAINTRFTHFTATQTGGSTGLGILTQNGSVTLTDVTLVSSGSGVSFGFYTANGIVTVTNSTFNASGNITSIAFNNTWGIVTGTNSTFNASGGDSSLGFLEETNGKSTLTNSTFNASGGNINSYGVKKDQIGIMVVFNSQLSGTTAATFGLSGNDCTYSINSTTHAPLNASCQ